MTVVVVPSWLTAWVTLAVLVMKLALPLYVAVIVAWPIASLAVLNDAEPPLRVTVPRVVVPFMNVTEPAGVPLPLLRVAIPRTVEPMVNVTMPVGVPLPGELALPRNSTTNGSLIFTSGLIAVVSANQVSFFATRVLYTMPVGWRQHLKKPAATGFFTLVASRWSLIIGYARVSTTGQNLGSVMTN